MPTVTNSWPLRRSPIVAPNFIGGMQRQQMLAHLHSAGLELFHTSDERFASLGGFAQDGMLYVPDSNGGPPLRVGVQKDGANYYVTRDRAEDGGAVLVSATPTGTVSYRLMPPTTDGNERSLSITPFPGGAMHVNETQYNRATITALQTHSYTLHNGSYVNY